MVRREHTSKFVAGVRAKPPQESKTVIVNVLTAAVALLTAAAGSGIIAANPKWTAVVVAGIAIGNIALRLVTKAPLDFSSLTKLVTGK